MALLGFLFEVFTVSLTGALAPGPVTAAAIAAGARNRFAGTLMALGHAAVELPLVILIALGVGTILKSAAAQTVIGLAGGSFLVWMGIQMLRSLSAVAEGPGGITQAGPFMAGVILSAANPYFLIWWATVGLLLATKATDLGLWAFVLFYLVHWSCDLVWLTALGWASFGGTVILGPRSLRVVLGVCAVALVVFGLLFLTDSLRMLGGLCAAEAE